MKAIDLTGKVFGYWTVIKRDGRYNNGDARWLCRCICGKEKQVRGRDLRDGTSKSCKCKRVPPNIKHGLYKTRLHGIWETMKARCNNKNFSQYKRYGLIGVKVCKEWNNDFLAFYNWAMANGYKDNLTIDRINVFGNYEPSNCRWATPMEQANNRKNNRYITYRGIKKSLSNWSRYFGISKRKLVYRMDEKNMPFESALQSCIK